MNAPYGHHDLDQTECLDAVVLDAYTRTRMVEGVAGELADRLDETRERLRAMVGDEALTEAVNQARNARRGGAALRNSEIQEPPRRHLGRHTGRGGRHGA